MKTQLKIKIKSLAAESIIIRQEETKWRNSARHLSALQNNKSAGNCRNMRKSLREHRIHVVRPEARTSLLAYGFLRGREYKTIEQSCHENNGPKWSQIETTAERFVGSDQFDKKAFDKWKERGLK